MQLHRKIMWLFISVGLVPLVVLTVSGVRHTSEMLEREARIRAEVEARRVGDVLQADAAAVDAALRLIVSTSPADSLASSTYLTGIAPSGGAQPGLFRFLRTVDASGRVVAESEGSTTEDDPCAADRHEAVIERVVVTAEGGRVVAGYSAGRSLGSDVRARTLVRGGDGRLILAPDCHAAASASPGTGSGPASDAQPSLAERDGPLSSIVLADPPWTVTVSAPSSQSVADLLTPTYLLPMGLLAVLVFLATLTVRGSTEHLEHLITAARSVGQGNLRVWLPPPGPDEVGRLSLQFSEMTSQLRETMEQVDRSGRLAMIGKLSSYLAHEIRNPLSAVKMNLQRMERWARAGDIPERCKEPLRISLGEVDRLSTAVSNVLQLSRSHNQQPEPINAHELIREVGMLLDQEFARRGVTLRWELDAEADRIMGRPGQLKGVVLNLMLNALDAQPEGGELLIRSRLTPAPTTPSGPYLELCFRDRGPGIPGDIRDRIFEPFFTTKATGSGIGLAVASQAVREHGGDLRLEEAPRPGAEFVVSLPLASLAAEAPSPTSSRRLAQWMEGPSAEQADAPDTRYEKGR